MQSFEISRFEPLLSLPRPIHVVTHDAGAAEHIYFWLSELLSTGAIGRESLRIECSGPAKDILYHSFNELSNLIVQSSDQPVHAKSLLAGSGWASDKEWLAIRAYRRRKLPAVVVIDHWVNYRQRMIRGGVAAEADQYWVVDDEAEKIARSIWAHKLVRQMPDIKMQKLVSSIKPGRPGQTLLYAAEPFEPGWTGRVGKEIEVLGFALSNIDKFETGHTNILVRPHPTEREEKYAQISTMYQSLPIQISRQESLAEVLSKASAVVAPDSSLLAVALELGLPAYCSLPRSMGKCRLPHTGIKYLYQTKRNSTTKEA